MNTPLDKQLFDTILSRDIIQLESLLENGVNPNTWLSSSIADHPTGADKIPALALAASLGHTLMVERLLNSGAAINAQCIKYACFAFSDDDVPFYEDTALCLAVQGGHLQTVQFLLDNRADVDTFSPLCKASRLGYLSIVQQLLKAGAIVNQTDQDLNPPLYYAAIHGHLDVMDCLYEHNAIFSSLNQFSEAKKRAKSKGLTKVINWMANHEVELFRPYFSFFQIHLDHEDYRTVYAEIICSAYNKPMSWGPMISEELTTDSPWGSHRIEKTAVRTYEFGEKTVQVKEIEHHNEPHWGPSGITLKKEHYKLNHSYKYFLTIQSEPLNQVPPVILLGHKGTKAQLLEFNANIQAHSFSFEMEWVDYADNEYALRKKLKKKT